MIVDKIKTIEYIKSWITDYAISNNINNLHIFRDKKRYSLNEMLLFDICKSLTKFRTFDYLSTSHGYELNPNNRLNGNDIILSSIDRTDSNIIRKYNKYQDGNADVFPFLDLYKSEIYFLQDDFSQDEALNINKETAEIEWADAENERTNIIKSDLSPQTYPTWFRYTLPQKELISQLWQREKATRHKIIHRPYPEIRKNSHLVK